MSTHPPPFQALGGAAGFAAIGGDVPHALTRRGLKDLDKCFNVTERAFYWHRRDRAGVTDTFYLLLAPEQVTFAYNTRCVGYRPSRVFYCFSSCTIFSERNEFRPIPTLL